mgnify:FL=1|tara:strand:+ start:205 stop:375 length:171 start_codon:yes stop_codon:yes gene_type:complete
MNISEIRKENFKLSLQQVYKTFNHSQISYDERLELLKIWEEYREKINLSVAPKVLP